MWEVYDQRGYLCQHAGESMAEGRLLGGDSYAAFEGVLCSGQKLHDQLLATDNYTAALGMIHLAKNGIRSKLTYFFES